MVWGFFYRRSRPDASELDDSVRSRLSLAIGSPVIYYIYIYIICPPYNIKDLKLRMRIRVIGFDGVFYVNVICLIDLKEIMNKGMILFGFCKL